jgi:hypothetical protein
MVASSARRSHRAPLDAKRFLAVRFRVEGDRMAPQSLARRVDTLEHRVEALEVLPERLAGLELQFVQFREEVRGEFSAVRAELRAEIQAGDEETRRLMRTLR